LQTRNWEGQDGTKKQRTEIVATDINFVDRAGESMDSDVPAKTSNDTPSKSKKDDVQIEDMGEGEINLDDIPF
jgi:single-stranded DNA-binding protein